MLEIRGAPVVGSWEALFRPPLGSDARPDLAEWMLASGCYVGLGDGDGLNFATFAVSNSSLASMAVLPGLYAEPGDARAGPLGHRSAAVSGPHRRYAKKNRTKGSDD
jgi:hypothetical protein